MKTLSRAEAVRAIYATMVATDPTMTLDRAEAAYDRVLADRALQAAEKAAENHIGTIEPDLDPENADWLRHVGQKPPEPHTP